MRISDWSSDVCSSDLDFKLILSDAFLEKSPGQKRSALSAFKNGLADAWAAAGFVITGVEAGSGSGFIQIDMDYPTILDGHDALRPQDRKSTRLNSSH